MRSALKMSACAAVIVLASVVNGWSAGDKSLAVMDFERVLRDYYKFGPAEAEMDKQKADFKAEIERRLKTLDQMGQDYEVARDAAQNKALNDEALKTKLADAEKKLMELKEYQQDVKRYSDDEKKRIIQDSLRVRRRFSEEISEAVQKYAADNKITLVIDSSSSLEELRGAVVYRDDSLDITTAILRIMNDSKPGDAVKGEKPDLKK